MIGIAAVLYVMSTVTRTAFRYIHNIHIDINDVFVMSLQCSWGNIRTTDHVTNYRYLKYAFIQKYMFVV